MIQPTNNLETGTRGKEREMKQALGFGVHFGTGFFGAFNICPTIHLALGNLEDEGWSSGKKGTYGKTTSYCFMGCLDFKSDDFENFEVDEK